MVPGFRKTAVRSPLHARIQEGVTPHTSRKEVVLLTGFAPGLWLNPYQSRRDMMVPSSLSERWHHPSLMVHAALTNKPGPCISSTWSVCWSQRAEGCRGSRSGSLQEHPPPRREQRYLASQIPHAAHTLQPQLIQQQSSTAPHDSREESRAFLPSSLSEAGCGFIPSFQRGRKSKANKP